MFSFHAFNYCISTRPDSRRRCPKSSCWLGQGSRAPATGTSQRCWKGMAQHRNTSSGELSPLVVSSYAHLLPSQKPALLPLQQSAPGLGELLNTRGCGAAPRAQSSLLGTLHPPHCQNPPQNTSPQTSRAAVCKHDFAVWIMS